MAAEFGFILFFLAILGGVGATDVGTDDGGMSKEMYIVGGVMLLIGLVVLIVICADAVLHVATPAPAWSSVVQIINSINTGFQGVSDGLRNVDANTVQRIRTGTFEADGAMWGAALTKGKHLFEIYWPRATRGTFASVGVGTAKAPLMVKPKDSLVGCNADTWGLDIARYKCLHKNHVIAPMPRNKLVPDTFLMYVDCDSGILGFGTAQTYWGAPISIPKNRFPVYPMIGTIQPMSQITMRYKGSALDTVGDTGYGIHPAGHTVMTTSVEKY